MSNLVMEAYLVEVAWGNCCGRKTRRQWLHRRYERGYTVGPISPSFNAEEEVFAKSP